VIALRALGLLVIAATVLPANASEVPAPVRRALRAASVEILPGRCAGVVAGSAALVVTAAHCLSDGDENLHVRLGGAVRSARLAATDEVADQVVLVLDRPLPVDPLPIARQVPIPGSILFFEGNPDRPRLQSLRLDRIDRCPSLPQLPNALFTSLRGEKGDSGAPLLDVATRVVGLVHGGARCQIATPSDHLVRLVMRVLELQTAEGRNPARSCATRESCG